MRTGVGTIAAVRAARRKAIFMRAKITRKNPVRNDAPDRVANPRKAMKAHSLGATDTRRRCCRIGSGRAAGQCQIAFSQANT